MAKLDASPGLTAFFSLHEKRWRGLGAAGTPPPGGHLPLLFREGTPVSVHKPPRAAWVLGVAGAGAPPGAWRSRPAGRAAQASACQPSAKRSLISQREALRPPAWPPRPLCLGHNCLGHLSNSVINCFGEAARLLNSFPPACRLVMRRQLLARPLRQDSGSRPHPCPSLCGSVSPLLKCR